MKTKTRAKTGWIKTYRGKYLPTKDTITVTLRPQKEMKIMVTNHLETEFWSLIRSAFGTDPIPPNQLNDLRNFYYAGALTLKRALDNTPDDPEAADTHIKALVKEIDDHANKVIKEGQPT